MGTLLDIFINTFLLINSFYLMQLFESKTSFCLWAQERSDLTSSPLILGVPNNFYFMKKN